MKISIIIPTRERPRYLPYSIRTALEIADDDIEVVVNDNASNDETGDVVRAFDDPRLRYFNTGARVSMRENFNQAVLNSSGDYVIVFGDDDGILARQFPHLRRILEQHRPDGLSWNRATYVWPEPGFGKKTGGVRFYRGSAYGQPIAYDPAQNAQALLGCRLADMTPTANIYHGCIARRYLEQVAPARDMFFDGSIPDVNFEYRATLTGGKFLHCDHAFSINGISPVSNGSAHKGFAADDPRAAQARKFDIENRADPLKDVMESARFVPLVMFATLETVRHRMSEPRKPDYKAWYHYVASAARGRGETEQNVMAILETYADAQANRDLLRDACALPARRRKTIGQRLARLHSQYHSFRRSAGMDGENTILSAANVYDAVLGDGFDAVASGRSSRRGAWRAALGRSKAFQKEI